MKKVTFLSVLIATLVSFSLVAQTNAADGGKKPAKLLVELPDYIETPDGLARDRDGKILIACPNYGDQKKCPAVIISLDKNNKVRKYATVPPLKETGVACPMGIEVGPDNNIYICDNQDWPLKEPKKIGRILRLVRGPRGRQIRWETVVSGISHPNGIKIKDGYIYVTHSMIQPDPKDGKLVSGVYKFPLRSRNLKVKNEIGEKYLLTTFRTEDPKCQYGADGLIFDSKGNLYVGNFGDAVMHKVTFNKDGSVKSNTRWAGDKTKKMKSIDGICIDKNDVIYVADFSNNAICTVSPDGKINILAQNPDTDGSDGKIDEPGEPILRGNELIISNFDMVTGPDKLNKKHDDFQHLSVVELEEDLEK